MVGEAGKYDRSLMHDTAPKFILHPSHPKQSHLNRAYTCSSQKHFPKHPFTPGEQNEAKVS